MACTVTRSDISQLFSVWQYEEYGVRYSCNFRGEPYCTERLKVLKTTALIYWVMCVKLSTADVGSAMTQEVHSLNPVCNVDRLMCCTCSIYWMWKVHFDVLQRPNRAVPDRGSVLKNNQFAVMHNILSVVGVFGTSCITCFSLLTSFSCSKEVSNRTLGSKTQPVLFLKWESLFTEQRAFRRFWNSCLKSRQSFERLYFLLKQ